MLAAPECVPSQTNVLTRIEDLLVGPAPADVRRNMRIELGASMAAGPYQAALLFVPVVMQRLGADAGMIGAAMLGREPIKEA